jgi:hypothetical protein
MSNLSVQASPVQSLPAPAKTSAPTPGQQPAEQPAALKQDQLEWKTVPASERIKTAVATTFKQTIVPYTVGGALAAPAAGAVLGGFIGLFSGQSGKFALAGAKAGMKFMPHGAAAGAVVSGVDAAVTGTVVGSAPDKKSAMLRLGTLTTAVGVLTARDKFDLIGAGVGGAAESIRAGQIFDKTEAALKH